MSNENREPWAEYRTHAADTAYSEPGTDEPFRIRAHTPNSSGEWAKQMRGAHPAHGVKISEPTASNPMQSAPHVLFAAHDARGRFRTAPHSRITKTHPHALATYCEGDLTTEFYATAELRDRALFLLERAL